MGTGVGKPLKRLISIRTLVHRTESRGVNETRSRSECPKVSCFDLEMSLRWVALMRADIRQDFCVSVLLRIEADLVWQGDWILQSIS